MKKICFLLCAILMCASLLLMLTACDAKLDSPGEITLDEATLTISWEKVPGAYGYSVTISGKEKVTKANSYSLVDLAPGEYTIEVKALGDGENVSDSVTVKYDFEREQETGLIYKLINNNTAYQLVEVGSASGDVVMESYYRGKPVTEIAPTALSNTSRITSFTVNEFVKKIPEKAFENCNELTKVVIPSNVTQIDRNAFKSCKALTEVVIPDTVSVISEYAFSYCRALEKVTLGNATTEIGNYAFSDCSALKSIYIPDTVKKLGDFAFSGCKAATSLYIGKNVESIGEFCFYSLEAVESITLPAALKTIGNNAFEECVLIKDIVIPQDVTKIGDEAFISCAALATVQVGDKIEKIGADAFTGTAYLENYENDIVYVGDWIIACKNKEIAPREDISTYFLDGNPIGIADYAFYKCVSFTTADIATVKYIGDYAFAQCENLTSVKLGVPCTTIGEGSFADCAKLSTVIISSSSVSYIDAFAFVNCKALTKIDLPETIEMIGSRAFHQSGLPVAVDGVIYADNWVVGVQDATSVSNVTVRDGTIGIAMYSFFDCKLIGEVKLPNSLKVIGKGAFTGCSTVKIEEMPTSLERIEDYAFYGCNSSQFGGDDYHIALPESLTYIGRSAFYGALVMGLEIPSSCKYIGDYAFWGAMYLGAEVNFNTIVPGPDGTNEIVKTTRRFYLTINDGVEYIGSRAFFNTGIIDLVIPDSVTEIGIRAFYGCDDLKTVTIGHGLTKIPDYAFYNCVKLEEVTMVAGTVDIGAFAFQNCKALTKVRLSETLSTIGKAAFLGCESLVDLELPASVTEIEAHAFRGMRADGSIIIHSGILSIGDHALYANPNLTVYAEGDAVDYRTLWNSSWRPVIYGCTLSQDKSFVVSVTVNEGTVTNAAAVGGISEPERSGYKFEGWAITEGGKAILSAQDISAVANGTTLYAVWLELTTK